MPVRQCARNGGSTLMTTSEVAKAVEEVSLTIDGIPVTVPKGTLLIRAAETIGIEIPRFCDHPLLDPVGACRQCIVEVEGQRKPVASCTIEVSEGMVVKTQLTSKVAAGAQAGTMELLLINHPLDCPVCDKGGECPLQNQAMSAGRPDSRFVDTKRTYPKPLPISSEILLDRERCVLCARCTRFSQQVAGDPFIELFERGSLEQVAIYEDEPFESYFSGNTTQICPVGALTSTAYRFRARPFDLVSTPSVCEHCSSGCAQRSDWRRGKVTRRLAGDDPEVNEEWNCDKGRFAFTYTQAFGRLTTPLVRDEHGELKPTAWTEALAVAAEGLREASERAGVGVLPGGRLTLEDAYAYSKFARLALGTNDIDYRSRPHSGEESNFLATHAVGKTDITYRTLEAAPVVLLVGFEPEEESPIVFLRMRKAVRKGQKVYSIAPWQSRGLSKLNGTLIETVPGAETKVLNTLATTHTPAGLAEIAKALGQPGAVILVGERLASIRGALTAAANLADSSGAQLAWIPRRAGERGALEAGLLPHLLPGGVSPDALAQIWGADALPAEPGRDGSEILRAARDGGLSALIVGGVDPDDMGDPELAEQALTNVGFIVSLEQRASTVTTHADVVFPVAATSEKAGTFLSWEGRMRPFDRTLEGTGALTDAEVLSALAAELDIDFAVRDVESIRAEWRAVTSAPKKAVEKAPPPTLGPRPAVGEGEAILATWRHLLDLGTLQDNEENLAGTAPTPVARISEATAHGLGLDNDGHLTVSTDKGAITLPLVITQMPDKVVWLPTNSPGSTVRRTLGVDAGAVVTLAAAGSAPVINEGTAL
ncbi:MAG: NADH-quinone oxidoreductase subunit G [Corynebacteriales bacterium]|nr:NADH-quinone oxidoreductase subunit G [Mycobacteriales bacterium]